ncbi:G-protein coupled receptor moody-like [Mytilus californianus]|uniref:G-protein coupled receptor moody-like n=1 Tax=Mytilus californianus TaxID=6549 RepID=UPI0022474D72|nr:G-protein coupled receptor moody-like [Mytilus californianus]
MANNTDYVQVLWELKYSDLALSSTILIIIGCIVGIIGNGSVIICYFFRIQERGERYFIPVLAVVDLVACITSSIFYVMDNTFFFSYPHDLMCRILTFLQLLVPATSASLLVIISVQRYLLVCKPHVPKMTLRLKRISIGVACLFTLSYSAPMLAISGIKTSNETFQNHTIQITVCKFSTAETSAKITVYFGFLLLLTIISTLITIGLFIPVLKTIKLSLLGKFRNWRKSSKHRKKPPNTDSASTKDIELGKYVGKNPEIQILEKSSSNPSIDTSSTLRGDINKPVNTLTTEDSERIKKEKATRRITIMFFVIIVAYVLSYIPALIILILVYAVGDLNNFISISREAAFVCTYLARFVFLNHIVNPFIYSYFDEKFRTELRKLFTQVNEYWMVQNDK